MKQIEDEMNFSVLLEIIKAREIEPIYFIPVEWGTSILCVKPLSGGSKRNIKT